MRVFVVLLLALVCAVPALAQGPVPVQAVPSELRASQTCNEARSTGAVTATIAAVGGMYFYINSIELNSFAQGGTVSTLGTPGSYTTTNIPGSITLGLAQALGATAGTGINNFLYNFSGNGLKSSAPGTAVTVVSPNITNMGHHVAICGYYAP